jgi:hypothetical protein
MILIRVPISGNVYYIAVHSSVHLSASRFLCVKKIVKHLTYFHWVECRKILRYSVKYFFNSNKNIEGLHENIYAVPLVPQAHTSRHKHTHHPTGKKSIGDLETALKGCLFFLH